MMSFPPILIVSKCAGVMAGVNLDDFLRSHQSAHEWARKSTTRCYNEKPNTLACPMMICF